MAVGVNVFWVNILAIEKNFLLTFCPWGGGNIQGKLIDGRVEAT